MKFLKSKALITLLLLLVAAFLAFKVLPDMYDSQDSTIKVVQLIDGVKVGAQITDSMLTIKEIGSYGIDGNVITEKSQITGKYAAYTLRGECVLYEDQFVERFEEAEGAIDTLVSKDQQLITISVESAAAAAGDLLRPGYWVDIYTKAPERDDSEEDEYGGYYSVGETDTEMELQLLLTQVQIYNILNADLEDVTELRREWQSLKEAEDSAADDLISQLVPAYITLIVDRNQAQILATQQQSGIFHFVMYPENADVYSGIRIEHYPSETADDAAVGDDTSVTSENVEVDTDTEQTSETIENNDSSVEENS